MTADYTTRSISDISEVAQQVMEAAYDLRAYELLGQWVEPEDVDGSGDTRYDYYRAMLYAQPMAGYSTITLDGVSTISNDSINAVSTEDNTDVVVSGLGTEFDYISSLFERYTTGDTSAYIAVDGSCEDAANAHCSNVDVYETTKDLDVAAGSFDFASDIESSITGDSGAQLGSWSGEFATQLSDKVVAHIGNISANHVHLLRAVQGATRLHWALIAATRESIYSIGAETRDKLKKSLGEYVDDDNSDDGWAAVMPVVGALIAAASLVVTVTTGGAAAPLTISVLSAVSSTVTAGISIAGAVEKESAPIIGDTVDEILTAMGDRISELDSVIQSEEQDLAGAIQDLNTDLAALTSGASKKEWEAFRPAAADYSTSDDETVYGPDGEKYDEFHHEFG